MFPQSQSAAEMFSLREENEFRTENKPVVNCFNKFFSTVGSKLAEQFQISQSDTGFPQSDTLLFKFSEISAQFKNDQLQHLDSHKATLCGQYQCQIIKGCSTHSF